MAFVDFSELKKRVSIEQTVEMLGLKTKAGNNQLRAACPACGEGGERALVITPAKNLFYCFPGRKGGDQIELVCHVKGVSQKDAALLMSEEHGTGTVQSTRTGTSSVQSPSEKAQFKGLDYLEHDHLAVEAVGFDAETAKALGIGFAPRGMMAGLVAVPIRLEDGTLAGYIGITEAKLPKTFHLPNTNVVPYKRPA